MHIEFCSDLISFQLRALPLLRTDCALNSLKLGILHSFSECGHLPDNQLFAVGVHHGDVCAVFLQARSLYFFADNACFEEIIHRAIDEFIKSKIAIPRVMGYGATARRFAECWRHNTRCDVTFTGRDYLYEITSVGDNSRPSGTLKRADNSDTPDLKSLFRDYYREDLGETTTDEDLNQRIAQHLADDEVYFWDDGGARSMVTSMLPFDDGVELVNVFTPQAHRRRGYAMACVSEVCHILLQRYPRIVLFVEYSNTAAKLLYTRIGFHLVDEMNSYALSEP